MGSQNPFMSTLLFLLICFSACCYWIERYNRVYSSSEEKARRFEIFKKKIDFREPAPNISQIFEDWIERYNRVYSSSEEKARRFEIFKKKIDFQKSDVEGWKRYGLHRFSDESAEDSYQGCLIIDRPDLGITNNPMLSGHSKSRSLLVQRSDCRSQQVDWTKDRWIEVGREKKFIPSPVRRVENQYSVCGCSGWAFSSVWAIEAAFRMANGPDTPLRWLSVQQILDCAPGAGCNGGSPLDAFAYTMKNGGLTTEGNYRYTKKNGTCDHNRARQNLRGSIEGFVRVFPPDDNALELALCRGPVTAAVGADSAEFREFGGGMFRGPCSENLTHAVLVVGFGVDYDGTKYWKIQNSWGEDWGEDGYMKMSHEVGRECGITATAAFPVVNYENWISSYY